MLLKTVEYNERNINWNGSREYDLMFLRHVENYFQRLLQIRGYVYLNQICEYLGAEWDPGNDNPCIRCDDYHAGEIRFDILPLSDGSYFVYIMNGE